MELELLVSNDTHLGEGPVWDHRAGVLYWVDILKGNLQAFEYASGTNRVLPMGGFIGAVVPTTRDTLLVALQNQVVLLSLIHISEPTRHICLSRMPSSA